jgi:hypothetical protein
VEEIGLFACVVEVVTIKSFCIPRLIFGIVLYNKFIVLERRSQGREQGEFTKQFMRIVSIEYMDAGSS